MRASVGMSKSKVGPCGLCSLRVKANSVLCVQCDNFICRKCEGNIGEAMEQEEKLCDEAETVNEFTYLGDRVSADEGCEAAVTARTRCGWVKLGCEVSCCMAGDFL